MRLLDDADLRAYARRDWGAPARLGRAHDTMSGLEAVRCSAHRLHRRAAHAICKPPPWQEAITPVGAHYAIRTIPRYAKAGCKSLLPLPSDRRSTPNSHPGERGSRDPVWRRSVLPMPKAVVGSTMKPEITRLGAAAEREGNDVVELQQEARPAAPPSVRIDVTAAATVAAPPGGGGCALPPDGPAAAGCARERPSSCATPVRFAAPVRFAGEGALRPRSAAASAFGLLWSGDGVGRGVATVAWDPRSATDFAAEAAVPGAGGAGLPRTGVLPPQVSRPDGGAGSAATAGVPAPPFPRAGSSADSSAGAGVLPPALVPSGGVDSPGCSCASRFAGECAPPAGPCCALGAGAWPALASWRPPRRPRDGRPGS